MRVFILGLAISLMACGETSSPGDSTVETSENTALTENAEFNAGPRVTCEPGQKLADVLELVGQDAHATPDPLRDMAVQQRKDRFGPFLGFVGNCYRATPSAGSVEQTTDIQYWALSLGGAAITIEHALEDGSYGGISYVYPAAEPGEFTYVYITSAGFHTQGTIVVNEDQSFTASETVTGHPTITEVRSISRFDETGLTSMTSEFLDNGEWQPGPAFTHTVTTDPFPRLLPPTPTKTE